MPPRLPSRASLVLAAIGGLLAIVLPAVGPAAGFALGARPFEAARLPIAAHLPSADAAPATPAGSPVLTPAPTPPASPASTSAPLPRAAPPPAFTRNGATRGSSVPAAVVGMSEDLQYLSGTALATQLDQYVRLGVKIARFQMIWSTVQRGGPASYDWSPYDPLIAGLRSRGIQALPVIDTTPSWARPSACTSTEVCAPADPAQYAAFAGVAAARYAPQGVHSWEIWNEANNPIFWKPAPNAAEYTAVLRAAYVAIHQADGLATVVTSGLAPAATAGSWISPVDFLAGIYANGGQGSFDAVGWHPYDYPAMPGTNPGDAWTETSSTAPSARSLMVAHGDSAKRIWATEFGAPTCTGDSTCVTEAQQAEMITRGYALWSSYSWAGPMLTYSFQDLGTDQANREDFFGLVRFDGSPKPAYAAYVAVAQAHGARPDRWPL